MELQKYELEKSYAPFHVTHRLGKFVISKLQNRGLLVGDITARCGLPFRESVRSVSLGHYPDRLKNALCIELGFSSWEELTQAALSAADV